MPRSKNDPLKRKCAQALNHLAEAVIDVNDVYMVLDERITRMRDADIENGTNDSAEAIQRYNTYLETLKQTMMYIVVPRNQIVEFIKTAWELDEERIKIYLG